MIGFSSSLLLRLWAVCYLHTALYYLDIQIFINFVFSYDLVLFFIAKQFLFSLVVLKGYLPLSNSRQKYTVLSPTVRAVRWVRLAIEHAQDVLSGGLGEEWEYKIMLSFFGGLCLCSTLCACFYPICVNCF